MPNRNSFHIILLLVTVPFWHSLAASPSPQPMISHDEFESQAASLAKPMSIDTSKIFGRIQFVASFPDYKVQVVDSFPDIVITKVRSFPDAKGKWQIVDSFPDFKIQLVDSFPDFKIKYQQ